MNRFTNCFTASLLLSTSTLLAGTTIVNGTKVQRHDPVSYSTVKLVTPEGVCSATLLSKNIAVTAAHCVTDENRNYIISDKMGLFTSSVSGEHQGTQVRAYSVPNAYLSRTNQQYGDFDFAVLYFDDFYSDYHQPAKVLTNGYTFTNDEKITIAGYGTTNSQIQGDSPLRKKTVRFITHYKNHEVVFNQKSGGACFGDSGGPAFIESYGEVYFFGIASRVQSLNGDDVCSGTSIYTNVNDVKEEINRSIQSLHDMFETPVSVQL
jgi:V8-like Glu-specific endopeptidase